MGILKLCFRLGSCLRRSDKKGGKLLQKSLPHFAEGFQTACIKVGQVPSR